MHVLVVDDEPDLRLILRISLERWGHEVTEAADAAAAWAVLSSDQGPPVDAMLLDVSMPGETGVSLLDRVREAGLAPPEVALLSAIVTGVARELDVDGVRFLAKPFGIDDLRTLVESMTP